MNYRHFFVYSLFMASVASAPVLAYDSESRNLEHWYHSPKEYQILDESPTVVDKTAKTQGKTYVIEVPNLPSSSVAPPILIRPTTNAPNVVNIIPSSENSTHATLPSISFRSNMKSLAAPSSLPSAKISNHVAGQMLVNVARPATTKTSPSSCAEKRPSLLTSSTPSNITTYAYAGDSSISNQSSRTVTDARGRLLSNIVQR